MLFMIRFALRPEEAAVHADRQDLVASFIYLGEMPTALSSTAYTMVVSKSGGLGLSLCRV